MVAQCCLTVPDAGIVSACLTAHRDGKPFPLWHILLVYMASHPDSVGAGGVQGDVPECMPRMEDHAETCNWQTVTALPLLYGCETFDTLWWLGFSAEQISCLNAYATGTYRDRVRRDPFSRIRPTVQLSWLPLSVIRSVRVCTASRK